MSMSVVVAKYRRAIPRWGAAADAPSMPPSQRAVRARAGAGRFFFFIFVARTALRRKIPCRGLDLILFLA
jgi:hypothetical protein